MAENRVDHEQPPIPLPQQIKLLLALAALAASSPSSHAQSDPWRKAQASAWVQAICTVIELDAALLPPSALPEGVKESAADQISEWSDEQRVRIARVLVEASLASSRQAPSKDTKQDEQLRYTPLARAWSYATLDLLGLPTRELIPPAEKLLSAKLFQALKAAEDAKSKDEVESTRAAHSQGWGGTFGRHLATGAGVVAGGILVGVTGGLAAPAIAALLAPLGIGGLLAGGAAPVVLGTLFGVGGGGLAGKRVRERWKGVEEFSFIEVGAGTRATKEEVEDLREAKKRIATEKAAEEKEKTKDEVKAEPSEKDPTETSRDEEIAGESRVDAGDPQAQAEEEPSTIADSEVAGESRAELEQRLLDMSLGTGSPEAVTDTPRASVDSGRPTLEQGKDEDAPKGKKKPPSLTATIVVPGLLVISKTEAITAWRASCASGAIPMESEASTSLNPEGPVINYTPRRKARASLSDQSALSAAGNDDSTTRSQDEPLDAQLSVTFDASHLPQTGLRDGRDVYLLRFETDKMLKTGRDIDSFIGKKLLGKLKVEIIKRTALNAYFAAVKLPLTAYKMTMMGFDNTWMQAQDRARKAGRLLGEVLEKKVQGERPVVLIGTSLGAYTIMEALLYLASRPMPTGARGVAPSLVESAILISLPSAPTAEEWAKARSVVARRFVNAYSEQDLVLAIVARLHEVISRAATFTNGIMPAGLGVVEQPGIEDVDVSSVLKGHLELQAKIGDVINIIGIDA